MPNPPASFPIGLILSRRQGDHWEGAAPIRFQYRPNQDFSDLDGFSGFSRARPLGFPSSRGMALGAKVIAPAFGASWPKVTPHAVRYSEGLARRARPRRLRPSCPAKGSPAATVWKIQ